MIAAWRHWMITAVSPTTALCHWVCRVQLSTKRRSEWAVDTMSHDTRRTKHAQQWRRRQQFSFRGYSPGGLGTEVPSGVQGRGPVESPQKLKQFADTVYRFRLQEGSIFWKYRTIHLLILDQCVSLWEEAKQHLGVKPPCLLHSGQWRI